MRTSSVPESDLKDQVRQMKTQMLMNMQSSADIARVLGTWELAGDWTDWNEFLEELDDVTPEEVRKAMDRYARNVDFTLLGKVEGVDARLLESF